ncbi:MAG: hypothetical protein U0520_04815 [Candidatus Saccharimonadales bacterium]
MSKADITPAGIMALVAVCLVVVVGLIFSFGPNPLGEHSIEASGRNSLGQLANGSTQGDSNTIGFDKKVTSVAAGFDHALALTEDGEVYGRGDNNYGQVGTGSHKGAVTSPQKISGLPKITAISVDFGTVLHLMNLALCGSGAIISLTSLARVIAMTEALSSKS